MGVADDANGLSGKVAAHCDVVDSAGSVSSESEGGGGERETARLVREGALQSLHASGLGLYIGALPDSNHGFD